MYIFIVWPAGSTAHNNVLSANKMPKLFAYVRGVGADESLMMSSLKKAQNRKKKR